MNQFLIALDQLFNTLFGGYADETLSARAWRSRNLNPTWGRIQKAIDAVFFWDQDHCFQSFISEYERKQLPTEYRNG
jgi:hypothetical protein